MVYKIEVLSDLLPDLQAFDRKIKVTKETEKNSLFRAIRVPLAGGNGTFDISNIKDIALRKDQLLLRNTSKYKE